MTRAREEVWSWAVALLLMAPAAIPWATHFLFHKPYSIPTGYIQADMPVYMAKAREYFDGGSFHLSYANPCSASAREPRLYHQPWTFALGLIHRLSGLPPRLLFPAFWFVAAWGCCRVFLAVYREFSGPPTAAHRLGLALFAWGGGLLAIAGVVRHPRPSWPEVFAFDPAEGWWFLNLGRNLVYPTESLYHLLAFACVLQVCRRKHASALSLAAITAACSPFAGLGLMATLGAWGALEALILRNRNLGGFLAGVVAIGLGFALYYQVFLDQFPEHLRLKAQMSLDWTLPASGELLAGALVVPLAIARICRDRAAFRDPRNRLLACWVLASVTLTHHEWWMTPHQPIHFHRGYAWAATFLLGLPALLGLLGRLRSRRLLLAAFLAAFLSDNTLWLARFVAEAREPGRNGLRLTGDAEQVLRWLDRPDSRDILVLSEDERIGYLAIAETPAHAWVGHHLETPDYASRRAEQEAVFRDGRFLDEWIGRRLLLIRYRQSPEPGWIVGRKAVKVLENRTFEVYRIDPAR